MHFSPWKWMSVSCSCLLVAAHTSETVELARVLYDTSIVPERQQAAAAAQVLLSGVNSTSLALQQALRDSDIDGLKRSDPELYYSYGHSPPVYPSPESKGSGDWGDAYEQAKALVALMTDEEKNNVTIPATSNRGCSGLTGTVERLGFPGICLNDGPAGIRSPLALNDTRATGFPAQLSIGSSWNRGLAYWRAQQMGKEYKAKGIDVALAPVIGPLGRVVTGGRVWEGFSTDPYLAGSLVHPTIKGLQESVVACAKHFVANEQETQRNPYLVGFLGESDYTLNVSVSSNLDDRTMHELYLWPFYDAVYAGVGSVMCSYQRINNSYACQNSAAINGLLKGELGFQGFVLSDWFAQHAGVASADAGLDMVMPDDRYWGNSTLATAVKNGSLRGERLVDMATRILASWYKYSAVDEPGVGNHLAEDVRSQESSEAAFQSAVEGHVLVKNVDHALPLQNHELISVFGWDAVAGTTSQPNASLYGVSLMNSAGFIEGDSFSALDFLRHVTGVTPVGTKIPDVALNGTLISGGGSGGITPATLSAPLDAIMRQADIDGSRIFSDTTVTRSPVVPIESTSGPCIVLINAQSSESVDRSTLADEFSDTYVNTIADQCANTIVVIHNAGVRLVDGFFDHENVTAILYAHTPGQASGDALVELLYGRQSPSGRLPYTVAHHEADYGSLLYPDLPTEHDPQYAQSEFTEGVFIDYRRFIKEDITPRFAFGYGLTYSEFRYSNFEISKMTDACFDFAPPDAHITAPPPGGLASLHDVLVRASVTVTNVGHVAAAEVPQIYVNIPGSGVSRALRGFDKRLLQPSESAVLTFDLRRRDLSLWDTQMQLWMLQAGGYEIVVGKNVLDIQGRAMLYI